MKTIAAIVFAGVLGLCARLQGAIVGFDLLGKGGPGLLFTNENATITGLPGSGGERGLGISFNDVTLVLSIDIGWGSGNGFADLSSTVTGGHIHGPTTSGGTASFTQDASVLIGLDGLAGWNSSRTAGGFTGTVTLTSTQASQLLAGRFYINVHTSTNGSGEIRGNLVAVPEPASAALLAMTAGLFAVRRRRTAWPSPR
jgi:hypothetical protein